MSRMIKVYKLAPPFMVELPRDAKVLKLDVINKGIFMYVELDPHAVTLKRTFTPVGTGQPIQEHVGEYIDSVSPEPGYLLHFYEDLPNAFNT